MILMLSLDLSEAFNNVLHDKLLSILHQKNLSEWLVWSVKYFLSARYTHIAYTEYESNWIKTNTDISQSSLLSLILFLFFILRLLKQFQDLKKGMLGFKFIDNTYFITWGTSILQNYCRLTAVYAQC